MKTIHYMPRKRQIIFYSTLLLLAGSAFFAGRFYPAPIRVQQPVFQIEQTPVYAQTPGEIRAVYVRDQEQVNSGQVLFSIADEEYAERLAQEQAKLLDLELRVPPEKLRRNTSSSLSKNKVPTLEEQLQELQLAEQAAQTDVIHLAGEEAKSAVQASRALLHQAKNQADQVRLQQAQENRQTQKTALLAAKQKHEQLSLQRARLEQDMQKLRSMQQREHISDELAVTRTSAYEAQAAKTAAAQAALDRTLPQAPIQGTILGNHLVSGMRVGPDKPVFSIVPPDPEINILATVGPTESEKIQPGMPCTVTFRDGQRLTCGKVASLTPCLGKVPLHVNATQNVAWENMPYCVLIRLDQNAPPWSVLSEHNSPALVEILPR